MPSFIAERPPRNPAEKMTSGYKACEYQAWFYILAPGFLYPLLPTPYLENYCKFVYGTDIVHSSSIPHDELAEAHQMLLEAVLEFEVFYYDRKLSRLNFICQCVHAHVHMVPEILHVGWPPGVSQWTMERTIGNLEEEIRQHSRPYSNLGVRTLIRSQTITLTSMISDLDPAVSRNPRGSVDIGDGFLVLRAREGQALAVSELHASAILAFANENGIDLSDEVSIERWAGLRLPNGHRIRTRWKEEQFAEDKMPRRYVQVSFSIFRSS